MFSSVDKMIVAGIGSAVSLLVGSGWISAEEGTALANIAVVVLGAVITAGDTWLWPNKA